MTAITATKAGENIYQLIQEVNASCTPITIINTRGKNAVLIGEEDWKTIEETLYLMSVPGMTESIIELMSSGNLIHRTRIFSMDQRVREFQPSG